MSFDTAQDVLELGAERVRDALAGLGGLSKADLEELQEVIRSHPSQFTAPEWAGVRSSLGVALPATRPQTRRLFR